MLQAERQGNEPLLHATPLYRSKISTSTPLVRTDTMSDATPPTRHVEHIFIITGPAGCGKTTVAQYLAQQLSWPYIEGDDFHTAANKQKMSNGIALTDADRWDWLILLRTEAIKRLHHADSVIVTCSALKHKYRDVIRIANYEHPTVQVHFVYLKVDEKTLRDRVASRVGHYMKEGMVHSQMSALEEPDAADETDVIAVDVTLDRQSVQQTALDKVRAKLQEYEVSSPIAQPQPVL